MKGEPDETEINFLVRTIMDLCEHREIGEDTALFLNNQVNILEEILDNPNSTEDQMEDAFKKLEQLNNRINTERKYANEWAIKFRATINLLRNT